MKKLVIATILAILSISKATSATMLDKVAQDMNKVLPKMIAEQAEAFYVSSSKNNFNFMIRALDIHYDDITDIDKKLLNKAMKDELLNGENSVCNEWLMVKLLQDNIKINYKLHDVNYKPIVETTITKKDCKL